MKNVSLVLISLVISTQAFACPDIQGIYKTCKSQFNHLELEFIQIEQQTDKSLVQFTVTNEREEFTYNSDGKEQLMYSQAGDQIYGTLSCTQNEVIIKRVVKNENDPQGNNLQEIVSYSKSGNKLVMKLIARLNHLSLSDVTICE